MEFVHALGSLQVDPRDIMVSFDVELLFTRVPLKETMDLLGRRSEEDILRLFCHVLTTSYFSFSAQFCEQIDGVAMDSPLSPVITIFCMEDFKERELDLPPISPSTGFAMWTTPS
jgi:hypothetical protein